MIISKIILFTYMIFFLDTTLSAHTDYSDEVKEKKIYPMGKKIYQKTCSQKINVKKYSDIDELKRSIKDDKLCKPLNDKNLDMLAVYLWDKQTLRTAEKAKYSIEVTKDEKCPVCGMFVYKYPKWATQIFYADKHYSFDGVKDMMKYYFKNKENISKILVRDYYSQKTIDARSAFYVIGSDIYGPMGKELIPFFDKDDAATFMMDHQGDEVLKFDEISRKKVDKLDE